MDEILSKLVLTGWTPGGVGIWVLVVMGLLGAWKVMPSFITAISERQSKIEERMATLLKDATDRFSRELAEADERHESCVRGQEMLRDRIDKQDTKIREQQDCIDGQQRTIEGLKRQMGQVGLSVIRTEGMPVSPMIEAAMESLNKIDRPQ